MSGVRGGELLAHGRFRHPGSSETSRAWWVPRPFALASTVQVVGRQPWNRMHLIQTAPESHNVADMWKRRAMRRQRPCRWKAISSRCTRNPRRTHKPVQTRAASRRGRRTKSRSQRMKLRPRAKKTNSLEVYQVCCREVWECHASSMATPGRGFDARGLLWMPGTAYSQCRTSVRRPRAECTIGHCNVLMLCSGDLLIQPTARHQ